jgi:hypothetical protein
MVVRGRGTEVVVGALPAKNAKKSRWGGWFVRIQVQTTWQEAGAGLGGQVREHIEVQRVGGELGEKMA